MTRKIIDVSQFNTVTSWPDAAKGVDGAIIRAGYRGYGSGGLCADAKFKEHLAGATAVGLPVGVYFLSQAVTQAEAAAEADYVHELVKPYRISLPVYLDSEYSHTPHTGRADTITAAKRTDCVLAFCERIKALGYTPGVYASESWFGSMLQFTRLSGLVVWCAKYSAVKPSLSRFDAWQYTDKGAVDGIAGAVDVSHFYKGFTQEDDDMEGKEIYEKLMAYLKTLPTSDYAKESSQKAISSGLFKDGNGDGLVDNPKAPVLRQDLAVVLNRMGALK